jgi:hypothetical protein
MKSFSQVIGPIASMPLFALIFRRLLVPSNDRIAKHIRGIVDTRSRHRQLVQQPHDFIDEY